MSQSKRLSAVLAGVGLFFLFFALLLTSIQSVGTDAQLYLKLQKRAEILPEAGINEAELKMVDQALADYLSGDAQALDALNGSYFHETEMAHMADCFVLFEWLRFAMTASYALSAVLICISAWRLKGDFFRPAVRGAWISAAVLAGLIAALGLWGVIDFSGLFTAFHRLMFTNDLWLLDPNTDLLIRICPETMFSSMALRIGFAVLMEILAINLGLRALLAATGRYRR